MTGERDGGKSGLSEEMLNMHGNLTNEQDSDSIYSVSAGSVATEAKFGKAVSRTTYPIEISEFGKVEEYGRREDLVEPFKTAPNAIILRRGRKDNKFDAAFPSLSSFVVNGNKNFTLKGEILKRYHVAHFSQEDRHSSDPNSEFNKFQKYNRHQWKTLGDWTMRYIYEHRYDILLSKDYDIYQVGERAIKAFYEFGGYSDIPEWLTRWIEDTSIEDLDDTTKEDVRAIWFIHINRTYDGIYNQIPKHVNTPTNGQNNFTPIGPILFMIEKIQYCLNFECWPWVCQLLDKEKEEHILHIDRSVLRLFKSELPDLTLKKLSEITGFDYVKNKKGNMRIACTKKRFSDFIVNVHEATGND